MALIRKGDRGLTVGRVHQFLLESNYPVPQAELAAMVFGPGTLTAVKAFQASHLGPHGEPLAEDGIIGPASEWALQHPGGDARGRYTVPEWRCEPSQARAAVRQVLERAVGEIGVCEQPDGSNDGPRVRRYTAPDFVGSPWCALFLSHCFAAAEGGSPFGRVASVWALFERLEERGRVLGEAALPQPGDIYVVLRGARTDPDRRGHCGLVCHVLVDGRFATISGNESNSVRGAVRGRAGVSAILRPIPLV